MPAKTYAGKEALEDLYDARKSYLTNERGWTIDCEGRYMHDFVHQSYPDCTALINELDITFYPINKKNLIYLFDQKCVLKKHTTDDQQHRTVRLLLVVFIRTHFLSGVIKQMHPSILVELS